MAKRPEEVRKNGMSIEDAALADQLERDIDKENVPEYYVLGRQYPLSVIYEVKRRYSEANWWVTYEPATHLNNTAHLTFKPKTPKL